jgi:FixJ family two-component response regulator
VANRQLPRMHTPDCGTTRRIALVDDDAGVRKALSRILDHASYDVETFASAREFIDALPRLVPACALIDLQMPEMTGLELQRYIAGAGLGIPTIIITAHDEPGGREQCIAAGASAYLLKPLRKAVLMTAINAAIECRSG